LNYENPSALGWRGVPKRPDLVGIAELARAERYQRKAAKRLLLNLNTII
jgi:hypothetical protein